MSNLSTKDAGKLALGSFFVAFADVEMQVGNLLKAMLRAEDQHQDLIIAAIGNFAAKINAVKAGLEQATTYGAQFGTEKKPLFSPDNVEAGIKLMNSALSLNQQVRVQLAHGHLVQLEDGSIAVTHLSITGGKLRSSPEIFTAQFLAEKTAALEFISDGIRELRRRLSSVVIVVPAVQFDLGAGFLPIMGAIEQ